MIKHRVTGKTSEFLTDFWRRNVAKEPEGEKLPKALRKKVGSRGRKLLGLVKKAVPTGNEPKLVSKVCYTTVQRPGKPEKKHKVSSNVLYE